MAKRGPQAMPIRSAGALVWRPGADGGSVLLIHRERYNDWTFPKGKREPGEHVLATAVREGDDAGGNEEGVHGKRQGGEAKGRS